MAYLNGYHKISKLMLGCLPWDKRGDSIKHGDDSSYCSQGGTEFSAGWERHSIFDRVFIPTAYKLFTPKDPIYSQKTKIALQVLSQVSHLSVDVCVKPLQTH